MLVDLSCSCFRNLKDLRWQPEAGCNLVFGRNGAGKSSLLEAVYLLATTHSFRTARIDDCPRHGSDVFHLRGEVEGTQRQRLEVGLGSGGRYRAVNGRSASLVEHLGALPIVAWTGEDNELLNGPPEYRRRFLNQGIVSIRPTALSVLARFRRTLNQKRQLLAQGGSDLDSWNEVLAVAASEVMALRRDYVRRISAALGEVLADVPTDLPDLSLEYRPSIQVEEDRVEEVQSVLEAVSPNERREGRPLVGPQRDELVIRWGRHSVRRLGSTGERKALGLLLTAAREKVLTKAGRQPIVLLDDADSELDERRFSALWNAFSGVRQVLVSSGRTDAWEMAPEARRWQMRGGSITPA